jgi:hypothetical protein
VNYFYVMTMEGPQDPVTGAIKKSTVSGTAEMRTGNTQKDLYWWIRGQFPSEFTDGVVLFYRAELNGDGS